MRRSYPDYKLIIIISCLLVLGILILTSVSSILSQEKMGTTFYFLKHQAIYGLMPGLILGGIIFAIPLSYLKKYFLGAFLINLGLVALVFLPKIGVGVFRGASRSLALGDFSIQPSEFLKLTAILYFASWLASRTDIDSKIKSAKKISKLNFIAFLTVIGLISYLLIKQPDISTLAIIFTAVIVMYFSANTPLWHIIIVFTAAICGMIFLIVNASYRWNRIFAFLNPENDLMGIGYQLNQSLIAIGSGGFSGQGFGMSAQKFGWLPHAISDSIFAIFAEESGFIGALLLITLFAIFFLRGVQISQSTRDNFAKLAALGITFWIVIQGFINIGSLIGLMPIVGIPLPFISYGSSHLISELAAVGLLLNISRNKM